MLFDPTVKVNAILDNFEKFTLFPKMDVYEEDNKFIIEVNLAGYNKKDVKVYIDKDNILLISGKMASTSRRDYKVRELKKNEFIRKYLLPKDLIGEPETVFQDGILKLTWVKEHAPIKKLIEF